jgi:hypothetical protein
MSKISQIISHLGETGQFSLKFGQCQAEQMQKRSVQILETFLDIQPEIRRTFEMDVTEHIQIKYHQENLYEHSICAGIFGGCYASVFYKMIQKLSSCLTNEEFVELCTETCVLHDIGKPFSRVTLSGTNTKHIYNGHAQLGSHLINMCRSQSKFKVAIEWAINHHMCYCTHCHIHDFSLSHHCYESMMMDISSDPEIALVSFSLLSVISFADMFSRINVNFDYDVQRTHQYSLELFAKLQEISTLAKIKAKNAPKLILHMIGLSGSGKSYTSKNLYDTFSDRYDIIIVEAENNKNTQEQEQIVANLNDALTRPIVSKQQIIIIDTCQTLFPKIWKGTVTSLSEEALVEYENSVRIGYYTIPVNMFGITHQREKSKTIELSKLPITAHGSFWSILISETETTNTINNQLMLSYATGSISLLSEMIIKNYGKNNAKINPNISQYMLHDLLNSFSESNKHLKHLKTCEEICTEFTKFLCSVDGGCSRNFIEPFVIFRIEQQTDLYKIVTFAYRDGFQQFNMKTRDYRGEGVLFDCTTERFSMFRPALPVFPEMTNVVSDHRVIPYIVDNFSKLFPSSSPNHSIANAIEQKKISRIVVTPKYDGSLFNLTYIENENPVYQSIKNIITNTTLPPNSYYVTKTGVFIIGSKGTCFAKDPVNSRIHRSILGSYTSIEEFLQKMENFVDRFDTKNNIITLHFEAIDIIPTEELTVYYGYSASILFGITCYNNSTNEKKFMLPSVDTSNIINDKIRITTMVHCDNFSGVIELFNNSYAELLKGDDNIEPEGFVIHIFDEINNVWFPIKYKYDLYYIAHKPNSAKNQEIAKKIVEDPQYSTVIKRYLKFREKPAMGTLLNQCDYVNKVKNFVMPIFSTLTEQNGKIPTKGEWVKYVKSNTYQIEQLQSIINSCAQSVAQHYPEYVEKVSAKAFSLFMCLYMHMVKTPIVQTDVDKEINMIFD